jgi:cytochrome P450
MDTHTLEKPVPVAPTRLRSYDELPGPTRLPLLGNLLQIETTSMHRQLERWCAQFGSIYRLKLGGRRAIVFADYELVSAILRDRPDGFRRTTKLEEIWTEMGLLNGVFGASGEIWRRQRRMVMAAFDPAHVRAYFPALQRVAQRLALRWRAAAQNGAAIDLQDDLMRYTVDTIAGLAFGADVNTLESDADVIQQHLNILFPTIFRRIFSVLPTWRWFPSAADRRLAHSVTVINAAVDDFIAQARARLRADPALREHPVNLLEAMLVAADEPGSGIDDQQIAGNVLTMLLAGEDTTANSIAWMIHLLWRHPDELARATAEVRRVCSDVPTLDQLGQLDIIEACMHETMRLKPVAPHMALQALRETVVGDVRVAQSMVVFVLMRRDAVNDERVPRACEFDPARWLAGGSPVQTTSAARRVSMPFGAGPRICPGRYLALLEMKMAMATLLGSFDIVAVDTPDGAPPRENLNVTMAPVGLTMKLRPRVR